MQQHQLERVVARHVELERMRATVSRAARQAGGLRGLSRRTGLSEAKLRRLLDGEPHLYPEDLDRVRAWCERTGWETCSPQQVGLSLLAASFPAGEAGEIRRFAVSVSRGWWARRGAPPPPWIAQEAELLGRQGRASRLRSDSGRE